MATITYTVTVASGTNKYGTGNKYYINGEANVVLYLDEGNTYIFDQSDSSNTVIHSDFQLLIMEHMQHQQV